MIYFDEWRQGNAYTTYPFADDQPLTGGNGVKLPTDFLIDAAIYPPEVTGALYLQQLDGDSVSVGAVDTGKVVASGTFVNGTCYLVDALGRSAGVLLAGPGFFQTSTSFTASTALFATACTLTQSVVGVTGLLLDDGTLITGNVTLKAGNGVRLSQSGNVIGIDFVGGAEAKCAVLGPPLKCMVVSVAEGSMLRATQTGHAISLSVAATRAEICPLGKGLPTADGTLPRTAPDFCEEIPEPDIIEPSLPAYTPTQACGTPDGFIKINSVSNSLTVESGYLPNSIKLRVRGLRNV